jgi:hypothetical protein
MSETKMANVEGKKNSDFKICLKEEVASQRASEKQRGARERERTESIEKAQQKQNI